MQRLAEIEVAAAAAAAVGYYESEKRG